MSDIRPIANGELRINGGYFIFKRDIFDYIRNNMGVYQGAYDNSMNFNSKLAGTGGVGQGNLQDYLNPYTGEVERRAITNAETALDKKQRQTDAAMAAAHSFGSRGAIERAVQGAEGVRGIGDLSAQLRLQGYDKAREYQKDDWARQQWNDKWLSDLAVQQTGMAGKAQEALGTDYFNALSAGKMQEDKSREGKEEAYKKWKEEHDYPLEMLNVRLASLGMSPYGHTETTDKTESAFSSSKSKNGMDFGGILGGGAGLLKGLLSLGVGSDRALKTDIEKIGTDKGTELPIYAYRYKGDPKSYPKAVGPMAQDVEKKYPQAVRKVAGKRIIDVTKIPFAA